jgi:hypothetical protein
MYDVMMPLCPSASGGNHEMNITVGLSVSMEMFLGGRVGATACNIANTSNNIIMELHLISWHGLKALMSLNNYGLIPKLPCTLMMKTIMGLECKL